MARGLTPPGASDARNEKGTMSVCLRALTSWGRRFPSGAKRKGATLSGSAAPNWHSEFLHVEEGRVLIVHDS
jgi:hypothetical protein